MKLLSPEDLHCYEPVLRHEIPRGHQILQGKMDLKTKRTGKRKARLVVLGNLEKVDLSKDLFSPTINKQQDHQSNVLSRCSTWSKDAWPRYLWRLHYCRHR